MIFNFRHYDFTLNTDVSPSKIEDIREHIRASDHTTWSMAKNWECPHSILFLSEDGITVEGFEVIGEYYRDLTYWCDFENKLEFCHDHFVLLAPKKVMAGFRVDFTFEDIAAEHGFTEWA